MTENKIFGSNNVSFYIDSNNYSYLSVVFTSTYETTDSKLILGGFPLSLGYKDGYYIPLVIEEISVTPDSESPYFWFSNKMSRQYDSSTGYSFLTINESSSADELSYDYTIISGMPLAINMENELIFAEMTGTIEEEMDIILNGQPFRIANINNEWYLKYLKV